MFAVADDIRVLENFTYGDTPSTESLHNLVNYLLAQAREFDLSNYELSNRFDVRPLVLNTALTYLELQGVIAAQSPFYREYKIHFLQPMDIVLAQFDAARADFLRRVFAAGTKGSKWLTLDMQSISEHLQEPKERITKALDYLAEQGALELSAANLRQTYRHTGAIHNAQALQTLLHTLDDLFAQREARDITRIHSILAYANNPSCLSQQLIEYFGEAAAACGICSHCRSRARNEALVPVAPLPKLAASSADRELIAQLQQEQHPALQHPRQLARFLCGLPSPATARSRLRQQRAFGALSTLGFQPLLALLTQG
jgi:ATP-dependent DNA helicase RecQ